MASSAVMYSTIGNVAVLTMNKPPVNPLSHGVRQGLLDGIQRAGKDSSVNSVIITGAGQAFCGGADITEFSGQLKRPGIVDVGNVIEASDKPVVAAIHGYAFGGGLEVALFCHYRVATKSARVGFPEVQLGILPGAAGTQRLPRVTSLAVAMEMIAFGKPVTAYDAVKCGILDKIVDGDIVAEAVKFLAVFHNRDLSTRRLSKLPVKDTEKKDALFEQALIQVNRKCKGFIAPIYCLKAVKNAVEYPYAEGLRMERELIAQLMGSGQSKALRYAFFSERNVAKWRLPSGENHKTAKANPVRTVAVVGAGTMGTGIAVALITAGFDTFIIDQNAKLVMRGAETVRSLIEGGVKLGKRSVQEAKAALSLLKPVTSLDEVRDVDLVIEAVFENMAVKQEMFKKLDAVCKPQTVLCSNTSTLDIDAIASVTKRPDKVIGCHFFVPAYHMRLLENIYGSKTSASTVATAMELGKRLNKVTVLVGNCHGFCANRLHGLMGTESQFMVEEGASPEQVDQVHEDFGFPMGGFKVSDLSGLDIGWNIRQELLKQGGIKLKPGERISHLRGRRFCTLGDQLYEKGRLGRKTGKGWYRYGEPGAKIPYVDDEVTDIIKKHCQEVGIERRAIPTQEILERSLYPVINEGFRLLEEKIVSCPDEIDMCWLHGFGFPRYHGGPMFYAEQIGLRRIYDKVCFYQKMHPTVEHWQPSELLKRLADGNVPMKQWSNELPPSNQQALSKL
ncbi:peroxisomal bifunctional enzyme-like [Liolophura sinensis]|uniref:peroxisomal bifunctional enzyme-like n=1 Tax=Liolophura sinensis TaxID=3198878 RepID=UPI00315993BD